jgi:hypothetical protein
MLLELGVSFEGSCRICCAGHSINLSLDAFLFANAVEALKAAIEAAKDESDITIVQALQEQRKVKQMRKNSKQFEAGWSAIPGLSKFHTVAVFIRSSTLHTDEWELIAGVIPWIDKEQGGAPGSIFSKS